MGNNILIADAAEDAALTKESILELIVAFAFIDDELHPKETEVLNEICETLAIPSQQLKNKIDEYLNTTENRENLCYKALEAISSKYAQERIIGFLIQIATSDRFHHQRELKFLNAIKEKWGLTISIGRQFKWDKDQKAIVQADYRDRMIVHAGPGMGKTEVACARVSDLIDQNVEPANIWMLSFTRTAVKEITDRISGFAGHNLSSLGVKVATIDSKAWRIRYGLTDDEISNLFGSFEQNIENVIRLFDEKKEQMHESFSSLEHVIIDEAQDITGVRAELLIRIMKLLDPDCGFTIFADPAQAIYGFTDDYDDKQAENKLSFLDCVREEFGEEIQEKELKTIHRTNNPKLVKLIEDLRLDIYVNDNIGETDFENRENFIKEQADRAVGDFNSKELSDKDNTLVLFRRRSEVLQASCFACQDGVSHRTRMSGHPAGIFSWVGYIFCDFPDRRISKERFIDLCRERAALFENTTDANCYEDWWSLLTTVAGKGENVDIFRLRTVLSRNPPPISFCYPDSGIKGPILGTIHASKGREADNVILRLPFRPEKTQGFNYDEESRVLYVGATRAKGELAVGKGFTKQTFSQSLESGRVYKQLTSKAPGKYKLATVEIGLNKELDEYSFVSKKRSLADVMQSQKKLAELASQIPCELVAAREKCGEEYVYNIWTSSNGQDVDKIIGEFNQSFNKDLFEIACSFGRYNTPAEIKRSPFYMLGLRTICKPENDPNLKTVHEPYSETGFWLSPVLIGYPACLFPARSQRRY